MSRSPALISIPLFAIVGGTVACGADSPATVSPTTATTSEAHGGSSATPTADVADLPTDAPPQLLTLPAHPCEGFVDDARLAQLSGPRTVVRHQEILTNINSQCNWYTSGANAPPAASSEPSDDVRLLFRRHVHDFVYTATSPAFAVNGIGDRAALLVLPDRVDLTVLDGSEVVILEVEYVGAGGSGSLQSTMRDTMGAVLTKLGAPTSAG